MRDYEIEQKLRNKVDNWELNNLKSEIDKVRNELKVLQDKIGCIENKLSNQNSCITELIQILIDGHPDNEKIIDLNKLYEIQRYL